MTQVRAEMVRREPGMDLAHFDGAIAAIRERLKALDLSKFGPKVRPPTGD